MTWLWIDTDNGQKKTTADQFPSSEVRILERTTISSQKSLNSNLLGHRDRSEPHSAKFVSDFSLL